MLDSGRGCVWNTRYNMNEIRPCQMGAQQWFVRVACSPTNTNIHVSQYPNDCLGPNNKITEVMRCLS